MDPDLVSTKMPDGPATPAGMRASGLMRSVNGNLRETSERLGHTDPIVFFCECADTDCFSIIWISAREFDETESNQTGWMLSAGHEPSGPFLTAEPARVVRDSILQVVMTEGAEGSGVHPGPKDRLPLARRRFAALMSRPKIGAVSS